MQNSNENDIEKILLFLKETRKMHQTYRSTPQPDGRNENIAEHSCSVALACMVLASRLEKEFGVQLDQEKMLKMALVHDMGEITTGDMPTWEKIKQGSEKDDEHKAMREITSMLPDDVKDEIMALWEECEKKETLEAKIVKSIDRIDPVLHRMFLGLGWDSVIGGHETSEALDDAQYDRHGFSEVMRSIYEYVRSKALSEES